MTHDFRIPKTHADLLLLCKVTGKLPEYMRETSACSSDGVCTKGNYFNVSLRYWEKSDVDSLQEKIDNVNEQTTEYTFKLMGTSDEEVEWDNDRIYSASFYIQSHKKSL